MFGSDKLFQGTDASLCNISCALIPHRVQWSSDNLFLEQIMIFSRSCVGAQPCIGAQPSSHWTRTPDTVTARGGGTRTPTVRGISSYHKDDVEIQATQAHSSHEIIEIDEPCAKRLLEKSHRSTFSFQWKLLDSSPHSDLPQDVFNRCTERQRARWGACARIAPESISCLAKQQARRFTRVLSVSLKTGFILDWSPDRIVPVTCQP
eukprot:scaffold13359_cov85-Skeletonema_dohrnii-CCMP3373.AAC.2